MTGPCGMLVILFRLRFSPSSSLAFSLVGLLWGQVSSSNGNKAFYLSIGGRITVDGSWESVRPGRHRRFNLNVVRIRLRPHRLFFCLTNV